MHQNERAVEASDWRAIANLGEQLASATTLRAQQQRIASLTARLIRGNVDVWLHEDLLRLPDRKERRTFPRRPRSETMQRAFSERRAATRHPTATAGSRKAAAAVPIQDYGLIFGVLQVTRPSGPAFDQGELSLLENIAAAVGVGLHASLRVEVERYRLGQLNLVRQVSAEIANVLSLDELARRVCELIRRSFNYYYVAIFTLGPGATKLRFRSSSRSGRTASKPPLVLEADVGQGLIGAAAASGEVISVPDVGADPRFRFIDPLPATRSEIAIPLKLEDRVLGVLDVQSERLEAFHPNDVLILEALADNVARAVEGARLYGDLRRRADQLAFLEEVSRRVTSTLDLTEMMEGTAELVRDRFGYQHVSLYTVHPNRGLIECEAVSWKHDEELDKYALTLHADTGIVPWVARNSRTLLAADVENEPRYAASPGGPRNTKSELAVPLVFGRKVLGVLDIQSEKRDAFSEAEQLMFEAVGSTIATAIRNADLYRSEQWRRQVGDGLREVAGLLSRHISLDEALHALLQELRRNLPVEVAVIWLSDGQGLHVAAVDGGQAEVIERASKDTPGMQARLQELLDGDQAVIRQPTDPIGPSAKGASFPHDYSSLTVPMRAGDRTIGLLSLAHRERGRYGHEARAIVETFASYAAVAVENGRLYDAAQEQAYAAAALLQVAQAVASPSVIDEVLGTVVRTVPILLGATSVALYGWAAARGRFIPRSQYGLPHHAREEVWGRELAQGEFPLLDLARLSGATATLTLDSSNPTRPWSASTVAHATDPETQDTDRRLLAVPLLIKGENLGVILVEEGPGGAKHRSRRLEIIQGIAQQLAVALQNDLLQKEMVLRERLETEVDLARQVQRTFIPQTLPERAGWELAATWQTARQVGGDFYDVVPLTNRSLGLFVADVADKGMPAALFMALTRTVFRAALSESNEPAAVLGRMNDLLFPDAAQGMFVTAAFAVLDTVSGRLTYANAGHNPPILLRANSSIERLGRTTMALGILDAPDVAERHIDLQHGDVLLMYTDGLTESQAPSGEFFGEPRLLDALRAERTAPATGLVEALHTNILDFTGGAGVTDDLTMLVVRRQ